MALEEEVGDRSAELVVAAEDPGDGDRIPRLDAYREAGFWW
jgi:hypothetical protein